MFKSIKAIAAGAVVVAVTVLVSGTSAASAAVTPGTLPAASTLYAFNNSTWSNPVFIEGDLNSIDLATGETTAVGTSTISADTGYNAWTGPAYNAVDGLTYVIDWDSNPYNLYSVDTTTGTFTNITSISLGGNPVYPTSMAIAPDGTAYVIEDDTNDLYTINLTTGALTLIGSTGISSSYYQYGLAINPVDGNLYAMGCCGGADIWQIDIDPTSGTYGQATSIVSNYSTVTGAAGEALAFDSNGTAWFEIDGTTAEIWSADINNFASTAVKVVSSLNEGTNVGWYTEAIVVVPGVVPPTPELPNTGVNAQVVAGMAALAVVATAAGIVLVRRRTA